jgi:predicted acyl esterase
LLLATVLQATSLAVPALREVLEVEPMSTIRAPHNAIEVFPLPRDIHAQRDVGIVMPDGIRLSADVFLPAQDATGLPVVLALTRTAKTSMCTNCPRAACAGARARA